MLRRLFVALLALVFCSAAGADLYVDIDITSGVDWPYSPYIITPDLASDVPDWMPAEFDTFCLERDVTFSPGNYLATIDNDVLYGGGDTFLDDTIKKVYAAYLNGELVDAGVEIAGGVIQESIWAERGYSGYSMNGTIGDIITNDDAIAGWNNVRALNLWGGAAYTGRDVQSQLVMTPVPGAGILGAIGLGLASWWLRRKKVTADS